MVEEITITKKFYPLKKALRDMEELLKKWDATNKNRGFVKPNSK